VSSVETDDISTDNSTESLNATVTTVRPKRVACLLPESKVTDHDADAEDADADGRAADAEAADRSSQHNPEQSG
jgi:hypothetical protein